MRNFWMIGVLMACGTATAWANPLAQLHEQNMNHVQEARPAKTKSGSCEALSPAEGTRLGMIRQMMTSGKPHAAIAHLDAARIDAPQADLLRADGLRQTGRGEIAAELYRKLLGSCVAGNAYQGLGLIAIQAGDVREAIIQLGEASEALPVDPSIRNDYGYALMMAEEHEGALHEFLTAIELAPGHRQAAHNLLLLLFRTGQTGKAAQFAEQFGISAADADRLKSQALKPLPGIALNDIDAVQMGTGNTSTSDEHSREQP